MDLEKLLTMFRGENPFRPMNHSDWETFAGANPGTYISEDPDGSRLIFAEPNGAVGVYIYDEEGVEVATLDFNVGPLTGFSPEAVMSNASYHDGF